MSLIKKFVMVCNRCGSESTATNDTESNVSVLGEDFFLCDNCLDYIIDVINGKDSGLKMTIKRYEIPKETPEQNEKDAIEFEELTGWDAEKAKPENLSFGFDPYKDEKREYVKWDDYEVEKVFDLRKSGLSWAQIAKERKLTICQIRQFVHRIRNAKPGNKYHTWFTKYEPLLDLGSSPRHTGPVYTDELVEKMFNLHAQGMTWNAIAEELNLSKDSVYQFTSKLKRAKPGSHLYELAKKYGYID